MAATDAHDRALVHAQSAQGYAGPEIDTADEAIRKDVARIEPVFRGPAHTSGVHSEVLCLVCEGMSENMD